MDTFYIWTDAIDAWYLGIDISTQWYQFFGTFVNNFN